MNTHQGGVSRAQFLHSGLDFQEDSCTECLSHPATYKKAQEGAKKFVNVPQVIDTSSFDHLPLSQQFCEQMTLLGSPNFHEENPRCLNLGTL